MGLLLLVVGALRSALELIPGNVSPAYRAAAFVSIHADRNADPTAAGFKTAPSAKDASGFALGVSSSSSRDWLPQASANVVIDFMRQLGAVAWAAGGAQRA